MIEQIKETIPIMDVLERYAGVNLAGARTHRDKFNICCPYHSDRSPSFTVFVSTNTFKCWAGCNDGHSGDVIDVVKLSLQVDTKEAIQILAADYGLKNPTSEQAKAWRKQRKIREYTAEQKKKLRQKVMAAMTELKKVEGLARNAVSAIKTVSDLDKWGDYYHLIAQIDCWLEDLTAEDPDIQIDALKEVNQFLHKAKRKVGESA